MMRSAASGVLGLVILVICSFSTSTEAQAALGTVVGFYRQSCPVAERLIARAVESNFRADPNIAAALIRMYFHDCFVSGCDASLLLDSTPFNYAEKDAIPNQTVRGYHVIDEAKAAVERVCPGIVSCADIIALATREAVFQVGGGKWHMPTGRRDGRTSLASLVNLPAPDDTVEEVTEKFSSIGISLEEWVTLIGAHTVGVAHCSSFVHRLYNFKGTGRPDPTMNPQLVASLRRVCPLWTAATDAAASLDQGPTGNTFDTSYYLQLLQGKGIMQIDQEIANFPETAGLVSTYAGLSPLGLGKEIFEYSFRDAMLKLGNSRVLTGSLGEIRHHCRVRN